MVLGMFPAITFAANEEPAWLSEIGAQLTPGTLISDYDFTGEDVPGKKVAVTNSTYCDVKYDEDGFKFVVNQDGTKRGTASDLRGRINFVKVTDAANGSYETGFRGIYVVDLTMKGNLTLSPAVTGTGRFDWSFGYNEDLTKTNNSNYDKDVPETAWNNLRITQAHNLTLYDNKSSGGESYTDGGVSASIPRNTYSTHRFIIDTKSETPQIAHYNYIDGEFVYVGSGVYYGDSVQGLTFNPRQAFAKDSYFIFKNVRIKL